MMKQWNWPGTFVDLFIHASGRQLFRASPCWDAGNKNKKADSQFIEIHVLSDVLESMLHLF